MKFSMTGQEEVTFWYRWLLNRGDYMGRFDCMYIFYLLYTITENKYHV